MVVAGAGPAGALAAAEAARAGVRVLLVDKKRRLGSLPHCAEFVPRLLMREVELPARSVVQRVSGMETRLEDKTTRKSGPGLILDRQVFDAGLALAAARAGAEVWAGARVEGLRGQSLILHQGGEKREVGFGALVAADGAASAVARALGLKAPRLLSGLQLVVPLSEPLDRTLVFLRPRFRAGYAWLFPKGECANLGLGSLPEADPAGALASLRQELAADGLIGPGFLGQSAGAIPVGGPRESLIHGRVILCGDAAGLTHPLTGAGIPQAVFSGGLAGAAAARLVGGEASAGGEYQAEVLDRYGRYLRKGLDARRELEAGWDSADFADLWRKFWPGF